MNEVILKVEHWAAHNQRLDLLSQQNGNRRPFGTTDESITTGLILRHHFDHGTTLPQMP